MKECNLYIDGKWIGCTSGSSSFIYSKNPTDDTVIATAINGGRFDVSVAVASARNMFKKWKNFPPPKRAEILLRAASIMRKRKQELGELVTREMGKILKEGLGDVQEAIDFFEYIAGEGRRMFGETTTSELPRKFCMTIRQPVGVVGVITPWNFPIAIPAWKIGAALVAGNTVVFKPSSLTPACAATLVEILEEAGLPAGVLNFVTGAGEHVGRAIVEHNDVDAISFTGGVDVGRTVYVGSAWRLKKIGLELGGKNPQIVMDDANIILAVEGVLFGAFGTAGQRCTATSRLIVHKDVYSSVIRLLIARMKNLKIGNPLDPSVDVGPVCSEEQKQKILNYIQCGLDDGAGLIFGLDFAGIDPLPDKGHFVRPTIFEVEHGMKITKEEIFGPVLSVIKVNDYEEAIHVANDVDYGLSASIYTNNINVAYDAINDLETGIVYVNAPTIGAEVHLPFGGVKNTGNGTREAGSTALEEFSELKTVFVDYSNVLQKAQIEE